jgi:hypothetical protein
MLPTGIFGFYSADGEELRRAGEELRARCGEGEELLARTSADGRLLLGCVISTTYSYPATLAESGDGGAIGVFDGMLYEESALARQPARLAEMSGADIAAAANGMFLAAAYREGRLRLLSDPFATLPLYYTGQSGRFGFSTSLHLLRWWHALRAPLRRDETGYAQYLSYGMMLDGRTMFEDLRRIRAAEVIDVDLEGDSQKQHCRRYYTPDIRPAEYPGLNGDIIEAFRVAVMATAASSGEGECIAALSGGIDSRTIAATLYAEKADLQLVTHYTHEGHDIVLAREVAGQLSLRHHEERLPVQFDLAREQGDFLACSNGIVGFNNIHATEVHRRYARHGARILDGNHTSIEGRWFMRNTAGRARTRDIFLWQAADILQQGGVLAFTRDAETHRKLALASLEDLIPDPGDYASPGCAADAFYARHLLPQHVTDLAGMQNRFIRYVSPYFDRRYVDLVARMHPKRRWRQEPQNLVIAACAPQLRGMARSYADVLSWPTDHPWLLRAPVAFERAYDRIGLARRWPVLHAALSRRRYSVAYDILLPEEETIFDIDDEIFDAPRIRRALAEAGPRLRDPGLVRLLQYVLPGRM